MTPEEITRLLNEGFRIIRVHEGKREVQMMKKPGQWLRLDKKETLEQAYRSFEQYLTDSKTIRF